MTTNAVLQITILFLIVLALTKPMSAFIAGLFERKRTFLHPVLRRLEPTI